MVSFADMHVLVRLLTMVNSTPQGKARKGASLFTAAWLHRQM